MSNIKARPQQPRPAPAQVLMPSSFPQFPQDVVERFPSVEDFQKRLDDFWDRTKQSIQEAQQLTADQVNSMVIYTPDTFRIYVRGVSTPMFVLDDTGLRLGNVLVVNTPGRKIYIGAGNYASADTAFYVDTLGQFSLGDSFVWDPATDTLTITGIINVTSGTIGGFDIGADYIRDSINSFGLASTVTGGDDVRFWAGSSFASRATAPIHITESGLLTARKLFLSDVAGTDNRHVQWQTSAVARWAWLCNSDAEGGGNTGSNLALIRYSDAGAFLSSIMVITRSNGNILLSPENLTKHRWNSIGVTASDSILVTNETSATNVLNQWSPAIRFVGDGWFTSSPARIGCHWRIDVRPVTGVSAPYNPLVFSSDISDTPTLVARVIFDSTGVQAAIGATTPNTGAFTTLAASGLTTFTTDSRWANNARLRWLDTGATYRDVLVMAGDNNVYIGALAAPASNGDLYMYARGAQAAVLSNTGLNVSSLAGAGTRAVVADASGNLSAP